MIQRRLLLLDSVPSAVVSDSLEREQCLRKTIHNTDYALKANEKLNVSCDIISTHFSSVAQMWIMSQKFFLGKIDGVMISSKHLH